MVLEGRPALVKFLIKIFQKIAFWRPKSDHSLSIQWIPTGNLFEPRGGGLLNFLLGLLPRLFDCQICRFLSRMQPELWEGETNKLWRYRMHVQNWPRWEKQTKSTDSERKTGTLFTKKGWSTHPFTVSGACIALSAIQKCWTQIRKHNAIENHHVFMVLQGRPALIKFLIKIFQKIAFWRPKSDHSLSIQWIPTGNLFEPRGGGLLSLLLGLLPRVFIWRFFQFGTGLRFMWAQLKHC